ncbi:MAG: AmmeMemoRadiSam system radical SAM enzyme [Desulfuromonadales bacterium]|nr:AmmeMemoRadiSam system radical SAM enzyme [Desulfuromonadales bacterium]
MKEAMFYERKEGGRVRCNLCRFRCLIGEGERGICMVRENRGGILYSLVYGKLCAESVDPIEKKPLFHILPGSRSYSIATAGCNFRCRHCQNYSISQVSPHSDIQGNERLPEDVVKQALASACRSIAYTYTEPTIFFEFAYDTARRAREAGLKNIFVTNGYISKEALTTIAPYLDAANIDLKGFSEGFYRDIVHARLSEVLDSIIEYRRLGIWIEITTLIIPGLNDSEAELQGLASFIATNLGVDTPWHVSQFYPTYKITDRPRTPVETLQMARDIGRAAGLRYVYEGNVPGAGGENTCCPSCSSLLIRRTGFRIESNRISKGGCPDCGAVIAGIGM